jgi:hypothetical protein
MVDVLFAKASKMFYAAMICFGCGLPAPGQVPNPHFQQHERLEAS